MDLISKSFSKHPKNKSVGVYIGPESIEIAYLNRSAKGISVTKYISKSILKKDVTVDTIKEIFLKEGIKENTVITTIPEESLMLRRFIMPIIPPNDRPNAVRFEAKRHIPFNIDEVISSFHIIKEDRAKNQMEVLFSAVKKEEVNSIIALLSDAGLIVLGIIPSSLALIKALTITGWLTESSQPTAILHFSTKSQAQIVIVEKGIPYVKREISLVTKDTQTEEQLINEIRLSSSYYKREFPENNLSKLIVCGLPSKPEWLETIKSELNIPAEYALPLKSLSGVDLPNPQLEIPIGLAAARLEKQGMEINLLPKELVHAKFNIQKIAAIEIAIGACILGLIYFSQIPSYIKLKKEVSSLNENKVTLPGLDLKNKSMDELKELNMSLQSRKDIISKVTQNGIKWHEKLKRLAEIMPAESWISEIKIDNPIDTMQIKSLTLKGSTYLKESAMEIEITSNFSKSLKSDTAFMRGLKKLTLGTITKTLLEKHEIADFDITASTE